MRNIDLSVCLGDTRVKKQENRILKKNYIYAVLTVLMWSTLAPVGKLLLNDIPNLQTLAISSIFAFLFLLLADIKTGAIKKLKKYTPKDYAIMAGLGFLGMFLYSALYFYGLTKLSSQEACIANYLWPIMLVLFSAIVLKEKLTVSKWAAMACSFLGIVILSTGNGAASGDKAYLGVIACVVAAACYGLFSVLNKKADYDQNIAMTVIWLVTAVCSFGVGIATEEWVSIDLWQWVGLIWMGVFINAVAYLLWALALKCGNNTAKIAILAYLTPFLSVLMSAVVLKEKLRARSVIALVFIVGGIFVQSFYESLKRKKRNKTR